jgi:hypothetical protein
MRNHTPRPPLAEIDTWELWLALRAGRISFVMPWLLLLAGFCAVLAGLACFFWLTARDDPVAMVGLGLVLLWFCVFLWRKLSTRPGFSLALLLAMLTVSGILFAIWLAAYALSGYNIWVGILGVVLVCTVGIVLGRLGIKGVAPRE